MSMGRADESGASRESGRSGESSGSGESGGSGAADGTKRGGRVLRTPPTPMRVDARRIIALGTAAWAVAAVVLAAFWSWLGRHDHRVWLWTCVCGAILGVLGLLLMGRHHEQGRF